MPLLTALQSHAFCQAEVVSCNRTVAAFGAGEHFFASYSVEVGRVRSEALRTSWVNGFFMGFAKGFLYAGVKRAPPRPHRPTSAPSLNSLLPP